MSRSWNNGNNWDYARWMRNVSRNAKANYTQLSADEVTALRAIVKAFCTPTKTSSGITLSGFRTWIYPRLLDKATVATYFFDADNEPVQVIVRAIEVIARDLIKIPLSATEKTYLESLEYMPVSGTDHAQGDTLHRALGAGAGFGSVIGSRLGEIEEPSSSSSEESSSSGEESSSEESSSEESSSSASE